MEKLQEKVFATLFAAGSVKYVDIHIDGCGRAICVYQTAQGITGTIHTKLGKVKHYKPETALRFLRGLGLVTVKVEMKNWSPGNGQCGLPL